MIAVKNSAIGCQMQKFIISIGLFIALASTGCTYKMDIQQGNLTSEARVSQLNEGMNQRQVLFVMGTPMLVDPFHANRWDYYYSLQRQGEALQRYRVTLHFSEGVLTTIERSGILPATDSPPLVDK